MARAVEPGDEFQFTFDLGDAWMHRCVVGEVKVDPRSQEATRQWPPGSWSWSSLRRRSGKSTDAPFAGDAECIASAQIPEVALAVKDCNSS